MNGRRLQLHKIYSNTIHIHKIKHEVYGGILRKHLNPVYQKNVNRICS